MSFQAMAWAVEFDLPVKQKMVLLMLANRTNSDTGRCDPSMDKLAKDCGMSKTSVKEAIRVLKEAGIVEVEERKIGDVNLPNQYRLNLSILGGVGRVAPQGGACGAPGVGRVAPPNLEDKPGIETDIHQQEEFSLLSEDPEPKKTDRFDEFWAVFPKKSGKPSAKAAWVRAVKDKKVDPDKIIAAAKVYAGSRAVQDGFVKWPQGWLNDERFNDPDLQPAAHGPKVIRAGEVDWYARAQAMKGRDDE